MREKELDRKTSRVAIKMEANKKKREKKRNPQNAEAADVTTTTADLALPATNTDDNLS